MARPQLPPLDLRGLPSTDAYGNRVELPEYSGDGMPTLRGPMPGAAVAQPAAMPTQSAASPAPSGFAERRGLERAAAAMQAPRTAAERIENQPNLFERMQMETDPTKRVKLERQFNALPSDAQSAQRARGGPTAFGSTPSDMARDAFNQPRGTGQMLPAPMPGSQPMPGSGSPSNLPFPEQVMIDYRDASGRSLRPDAAPRFSTDGVELSEMQPMVSMKDADGNQMSMGVDGQWHSVPQTGRAVQMASPGAVRGGSDNIYGTEYGPRLRGTQGAMLRFVEDPMQPGGGVLPVPAEFTDQQTYISNLTDEQRSNIKTMLIEQGGAIGKRLQAIEDAKSGVAGGDPNWRGHRGAGQAGKTLQSEEDSLIFGAMKDPSAIMRDRTSRAREQARSTAAEQKASQVAQERLLAAEQRRNAQIYERSYKQAEQELSGDPFNAATPEQVHARAMQIFRASGGAMPSTPSPRGSAGAAGAPGGMPIAGAGTAPQSGAPDLSRMSIAIDPQSPIDFEMVAPNQMVTFLPDGSAMRAMNFNGRAVAVPANQAELDRLPPGSLYVLEGQVRRGELKAPLRKEGETSKPSSASMESAQEEQFRIEEESKKVAGERNKGFEDYREQEAIYKEIDGEARRRAAQALGLNPDTDLVLTKNVRGEQEWEPPETLLKPTTKKMGEKGWSELTAWRDVDVLDPRGTWLAALERARKEVAEERFAGSTKPMPSWIVRGKGGAGISVVDKPTPPPGYDAKRDYTKPGAEDITEAERRYYGAKGTTKEAVQMERLLDEARKSTGAVEIDASGRQVVTINGRRYPAVKVQVGGSSARLPTAMMRQGQNPTAVAKEALSLLFSGKPFATVNREGKMIPMKFDPNHPMLKVMQDYRQKVGGDISATTGAGQRNPGAAAAFAYVNEVFGYLPTESRKFILDNLLTNKRLGNNLGGYNFTG